MKKKTTPEVQAPPAVAVSKTPRKVYEMDFKLAALARMRDGLQSSTALAMELGIRRNQLYKWAELYDPVSPTNGFKVQGRPPAPPEEEIGRLKRELSRAQEELIILKKFDAYLTRLK